MGKVLTLPEERGIPVLQQTSSKGRHFISCFFFPLCKTGIRMNHSPPSVVSGEQT